LNWFYYWFWLSFGSYYPTEAKKVLFFGKNVQLNDYVHITAMERVEEIMFYWLVKYISQIVHTAAMQDAQCNPTLRQ
jgi:hypothetical protein